MKHNAVADGAVAGQCGGHGLCDGGSWLWPWTACAIPPQRPLPRLSQVQLP